MAMASAGDIFPLPLHGSPPNAHVTRSNRARGRFNAREVTTRLADRTITALNSLACSFADRPADSNSPRAADLISSMMDFSSSASHCTSRAASSTTALDNSRGASATQRRICNFVMDSARRFHARSSSVVDDCGATTTASDTSTISQIGPVGLDYTMFDNITCVGDASALRTQLSAGYTKSSAARPLVASRISLPERAGEVSLLDALPPDVAKLYAAEHAAPCLRKPCESIDSNVRAKAYGSHAEYIALLRDMDKKNMLTYTTDPAMVVGLFAVDKPDGKLRLILDGRPANDIFAEPPAVELPTPDLFAKLQAPRGRKLWVAKTDLSDFFYRFRTPDWMHRYFALPAVDAAELGKDAEYGNIRIFPCLAVLAMGWSHSVFAAQRVHEHLLNSLERFNVADRITRGSDLRVDRVRHAVYIDDLVIIGLHPHEVDAAQNEYLHAVRIRKLPVKDSKVIRATADGVECLGIELHGTFLTAGVTPAKLSALCMATRAIIKRRIVTGRDLASLVGKWTWAFLVCRPSLSIFNAVYRYIRTADRLPFTLWHSAIVELDTAIALAPLIYSSIAAPFFPDVIAVDASSVGQGVCAITTNASLQSELASHAGLRSEQSAAHVYAPAPRSVHVDDDSNAAMAETKRSAADDAAAVSLDSERAVRPCAAAVLSQKARVVISHAWLREEHINALELRAANAAMRWALSSPQSIGSRIVMLSDSQVAVGSLSKGRSSSPIILRRIRATAALLLGSGAQLYTHWIPTKANPADGPSRDIGTRSPTLFDPLLVPISSAHGCAATQAAKSGTVSCCSRGSRTETLTLSAHGCNH